MAEDHLNLQVGSILQLQRVSSDNEDRYSVVLIGYLSGKSLLVTSPIIDGKVLFMKEGHRFAVRLIKGNHIYGFVSTVIMTTLKPYPYLHLSYPEEVESTTVRNAQRVQTNISGFVHNSRTLDTDANWQPVLLKDLSMTGARVESIDPLGKPNERMEVRFHMKVCGAEESLELKADVCSRNLKSAPDDPEDSRYTTGIRFIDLDRAQEIMLSSFVLEQQVGGE
ncbi:MAG: flagellar brake protein [Candidatus Sedimenticola sp. (ex Thyasira tokunagai)]